MRPKFIAVVLLLALGLLGVIALVQRGLRPQPLAPSPASSVASISERVRQHLLAGSNKVAKGDSAGKLQQIVPAPSTGINGGLPVTSQQSQQSLTPGDLAHAKYVRHRIAELDALGMERDAGSLNTILSELENPDKEIRKAALEAVIQFGDRSAITRLQEIASRTEDAREKVDILDAIELLQLPSLTEYLAERRANGDITPTPRDRSTSLSNSNRVGRRPPARAQRPPSTP